MYTLTATLPGSSKRPSRIKFEAPHDERAIFEASFLVMERAYNNPIWAKGYVKLVNQAGEILAEMPSSLCAWCERDVMKTEASMNGKDICIDCAGED